MATTHQCLASLARLSISSGARPGVSSIPRFLAPSITQLQSRTYAAGGTAQMLAREREKAKLKKKKRQQRFKEYKYAVPSQAEQFALCDAMRYIRAAEVGRPPSSVSYEISLKLRTNKNAPVVRNRIRLPNPSSKTSRVAVICQPRYEVDAKKAGAVAFGEESLFELIKARPNSLPFNRLLCHEASVPKLNKSGLGRILGPKKLMPSPKTNTVTTNIAATMKSMIGAEAYREKIGVIRMSIGNIRFTPQQLADNIKALIQQVKEDLNRVDERHNINKDLIEVVLCSTNSPGFTLHGGFASTDEKLAPEHLTTAM